MDVVARAGVVGVGAGVRWGIIGAAAVGLIYRGLRSRGLRSRGLRSRGLRSRGLRSGDIAIGTPNRIRSNLCA